MGMMLNADHSLLFMPNHQYDHTHPSHLLTHLPSSPSRKRKQKPWPLEFPCHDYSLLPRAFKSCRPGLQSCGSHWTDPQRCGVSAAPAANRGNATLTEAWWSPAPSRSSRSRPESTAVTNADTKSPPTLVGGKLQNTLLSTAHLGSSQLFYNILSSELTISDNVTTGSLAVSYKA